MASKVFVSVSFTGLVGAHAAMLYALAYAGANFYWNWSRDWKLF